MKTKLPSPKAVATRFLAGDSLAMIAYRSNQLPPWAEGQLRRRLRDLTSPRTRPVCVRHRPDRRDPAMVAAERGIA